MEAASRRPKAASRASPSLRPSRVVRKDAGAEPRRHGVAADGGGRPPARRQTRRAAPEIDDADFMGQHSVLHPEQVGEFALDADQARARRGARAW